MFEPRHHPLIPPALFWRRMLWHGAIAMGIICGSLGIGVLGYHYCEGLSWLDSFLNASMILSGMGPAQELKHDSGKMFAACYALFSGVAFITTVGVLFAPVVHRFLHRFHMEFNKK